MSKYKKGDSVILLRDIPGRFSGYGGRPIFIVPTGTVCTIQSGPHPAVTGRCREFYNASIGASWPAVTGLYNADIRDEAAAGRWPEGVCLFLSDMKKAPISATVQRRHGLNDFKREEAC